MREIKFRQPIWADGKFSRFHYWGFTEPGMFSGPCYEPDQSQKETQQFTGLSDRSGKEVWEGDIVSVDRQDSASSFDKAIIIYAENYASFLLEYIKKVNPKGLLSQESIHSKDKKTIFGTCTGWDIEVIGNIYENGELLGAKP